MTKQSLENNLTFRIILQSKRLAENTSLVFVGLSDVSIAPGSPEEIHPNRLP